MGSGQALHMQYDAGLVGLIGASCCVWCSFSWFYPLMLWLNMSGDWREDSKKGNSTAMPPGVAEREKRKLWWRAGYHTTIVRRVLSQSGDERCLQIVHGCRTGKPKLSPALANQAKTNLQIRILNVNCLDWQIKWRSLRHVAKTCIDGQVDVSCLAVVMGDCAYLVSLTMITYVGWIYRYQ